MIVPKEGDVWYYDYLWHWQDERGETEGRKSRPVSFVAVIEDSKGDHNLLILAITSQYPTAERIAIEIPDMEKRRAGLESIPLWIVLDEFNHDILERSFYFDKHGKIGSFSASFTQYVLRNFKQVLSVKKAQSVKRIENT